MEMMHYLRSAQQQVGLFQSARITPEEEQTQVPLERL